MTQGKVVYFNKYKNVFMNSEQVSHQSYTNRQSQKIQRPTNSSNEQRNTKLHVENIAC